MSRTTHPVRRRHRVHTMGRGADIATPNGRERDADRSRGGVITFSRRLSEREFVVATCGEAAKPSERDAGREVSPKPDRPNRLQRASMLLSGVALTVVGLESVVAGLFVESSYRPVALGLATWAVAVQKGAFQLHITRDDLRAIPTIVSSTLAGASLVAIGELVASREVASPAVLAILGVSTCFALAVGVQLGRQLLRSLWRRGEFRTTAVVAGFGEVTRELLLELQHRPELGIDVVSHQVMATDPRTGNGTRAAEADAIEQAVLEWRPDRLIVGESESEDAILLRTLRHAGTLGTRVYVLPRLFAMGLGNGLFAPDQLRGFPLLGVNRSAHPRLSLAAKRTFDIVASFVALVLLSPVLVFAAIAVRASGPGPILFWQTRLGQHGKKINVPKLRSMTDSGTGDTDWTAQARITKVGRILRRTAIDELPQLWSVLIGDMSLVGPRPERPLFAERFAAQHPGYVDRHRMKVGLTGLSQIEGLRGDTSISERTKYDNLYIDQWTFAGDLTILARTIVAIVQERSKARAHTDFQVILSDAIDMAELETTEPQTNSTSQLPAGQLN